MMEVTFSLKQHDLPPGELSQLVVSVLRGPNSRVRILEKREDGSEAWLDDKIAEDKYRESFLIPGPMTCRVILSSPKSTKFETYYAYRGPGATWRVADTYHNVDFEVATMWTGAA